MKRLPIKRRNKPTVYALVDDADYVDLMTYKWFLITRRHHQYAGRRGRGKVFLMHRQILGLRRSRKPLVDHRDGDGLNNQRRNIRKCSELQNSRNRKPLARKKFKGVTTDFRSYVRSHFRARIFVRGKEIYIGQFRTAEAAAVAYDAAAVKHFGEFALLNFPTVGGGGSHESVASL